MATGVCGIDCTACRLHRQGQCASCGPGTSELAALKRAVQERLLGKSCPILDCAGQRGIDHCLADCDDFPCHRLTAGPYPFATGFLQMQQRRRADAARQANPAPEPVPALHWDALARMDPASVCADTGAIWDGDGDYAILIADQSVQVSVAHRTVTLAGGRPVSHRLALVAVIYLTHARSVPLTGRWVSEKELGCASFFRGVHSLPLGAIAKRFGQNPGELRQVANARGAAVLDDADAAIRIWALPKVPLILRLWGGDEEMPAAVTAAFDASIEAYLPADGIWALTGAVADILLGEIG